MFLSFALTSWCYLNFKFDYPLHYAAGSQKNGSSWIVKVPHMWFFLHDCRFTGLWSLPKFLDLIPSCQIDTLLHHAAVRFDSPLHHAEIRFDSPLHHVVVRFDSPSSESHLPAAKCSGKILLPASSCSWTISAPIIDLIPRCIMQQRDLIPCWKMQRPDLTSRCIMQQRDLTPRCIMQRGVKQLQLNNSTNLKPNLKMNQGPTWVLLMKKTEVENLALLSL